MSDSAKVRSYPLSPMQQGMLFHALSNPASGVDVEQIVCRLNEVLDPQRFTQAWQQVVDRHDILRTRLAWVGEKEPQQVVESGWALQVAIEDWSSDAAEDQEDKLKRFLAADRTQGFELDKLPLMRVSLFQLAAEKWVCVWTYHHALMDGRAQPIVIREVFEAYNGQTDHWQPPVPYSDYIEWLVARDQQADESYWREQLTGFLAPTPLPEPCPGESLSASNEGGIGDHRLSAEDTRRLEAFSQESGFSLNVLLQSAWSLLLHHYSLEDDVVYGTVRAARRSTVPGADGIVGLFINSLPVRVQIDDEHSLKILLEQVAEQQKAVRPYEHAQLNQIQAWSDVPREQRLFDSLVIYDHGTVNDRLKALGDEWRKRDFTYLGQTNFPLNLLGYGGEQLLLRFEYDSSRFAAETIQRMLGHIAVLLMNMVDNLAMAATAVPYLTEAERSELIEAAAPLERELNIPLVIHQAVTATAADRPDAIAVEYEDEQLSYREMMAWANGVTARLLEMGIKPGDRVAVSIGRHLYINAILLGVLQTGAAYVPSDPLYPQDRLRDMWEDSDIDALVTQLQWLGQLPHTDAPKLVLDEGITPQDTVDIPDIDPDSAAVLIYTSGSTGKPKGVMVQHSAICNFLDCMSNTDQGPGMTAGDRQLAVITLSFDMSITEQFMPLVNGGTCVIASESDTTDGGRILELLKTRDINFMQVTPTTWRMLVDSGWKPGDTPNLKAASAGEYMPIELTRDVVARTQGYWNTYGPTETTIMCTGQHVQKAEMPISLGRVFDNTYGYLVDRRNQPVPVGIAGELLMGGACVTLGYLNRPELTTEKYIKDPFHPERGRMYHTGDLIRRWPDGRMQFIRRIDNQVKVRGFRIELGEIESVLLTHDAVKEAVVIVREDTPGDRRIAAYYVGEKGEVPESALRKHLAHHLPKYMMPVHYIHLDELPKTVNYKLDRKALPRPDGERPSLGTRYVAPRNELEQQIAEVWQSVLNVDRVGVEDNFFDLGGDSLLIVQLLGQLQPLFDIELTVTRLFEHPNVGSLAQYIGEQSSGQDKTATVVEKAASRAEKQRQARAHRSKARRGRNQ